jgi:putative nucleotidyltransferase with HDIG domain
VGGAINASMDLNLTLSILLDQVVSKLDVDACDVLLLNPYTRTLDFAAGRGFSTQLINRASLKSNLTYAWRVINQRQLLFIENISADRDNIISSQFIESEKFTSYIGAPLIAKKVTNGVLEIFSHTTLERDKNWFEYLEAMADQAAIAIDNATMFQELQRANFDISLAYDKTIEGWAKALELRDGATEGHSQRVMKLTLDLASKLGMDEADLGKVRHGALLHDIGKMGIPDSILLKPGPLTDEEWVIMKKHPEYAFQMLKDVAYLKTAIEIPHYHHEHWDGSGYPNGLRGDQIPLSARIFSVIDNSCIIWTQSASSRIWSRNRLIQVVRWLEEELPGSNALWCGNPEQSGHNQC